MNNSSNEFARLSVGWLHNWVGLSLGGRLGWLDGDSDGLVLSLGGRLGWLDGDSDEVGVRVGVLLDGKRVGWLDGDSDETQISSQYIGQSCLNLSFSHISLYFGSWGIRPLNFVLQ